MTIRLVAPLALAAASLLLVTQSVAQPPARQYVQYFLSSPPSVADRGTIPEGARDVIIAKVRNLLQPPSYLAERDQSGQPQPPPKDLFFTRVRIVEVLKGRAKVGEHHELYFGTSAGAPYFIFPHTPQQNMREYFVVSYVGNDDKRRLVGFAATQQQFEEWQHETFQYERLRGRPGARDR